MYSQHPEIAKKWEKHTPKGKKLPERVGKKSKSKKSKKKSKKRTHKESFLGHLSAMLLTEDTDKTLYEIEIHGFTIKPEYTHANSGLEAITNIITREFRANNRTFNNRVYPTLDHLIVALIGPKGRHHFGNVSIKKVPKR